MYHLLKNRTFLLFFSGNIISLVGFGFNLIAISWIVLEKTNSEFALGKIMATATAPGLFLAIFAGIIIDKVNRKWLLVILDICRMIVIIIFLLVLNYHEFELWMLYPVVILMGLCNSLFWPTAHAFLQELVEKEDYFSANALLSASYQVGSILGAGAGGFIVHIYSPMAALWINAIAYLISGILIALAPFKRIQRYDKTENLTQAISRGFSYLRTKLDIVTLGFTTILSDVAIWGSLSVLTISISKEIFNKGSWGYGLMDGLYGIGALISTIVISSVINKFGRSRSLLICYGVAGTMCFITPLMPTIYFASATFFFMGLHNNSARIIIRTIFMENIPNNIMGRVQTIFGIYSRAMIILSSLAAGWIIETKSIFAGMFFSTLHYALALIGTLIVINIWSNKNNIFSEVK